MNYHVLQPKDIFVPAILLVALQWT